MKVAVFSDVHDNMTRWLEAVDIIEKEKIEIGICCGDVGSIESLATISRSFQKLYFCFGNADYRLENQKDLISENVIWYEKEGEFKLAGQKIAIVHYDKIARQLAAEEKYDAVFYGHTHTPWEKKVGKTLLLNPGEIAGQFGRASLAVIDLAKKNARLKLLN